MMAVNQNQDEGKEALKKVRVGVWLVGRQLAELRMQADHEGRTVSDIIRQAIETHLGDSTKKKKDGGQE